MRKIEEQKKNRIVPIITLGTLCFIVLGAATWYFGYIRPRLNAEPVRIYKPVQPTEKTATGATEKKQTATPTDTNPDTDQDVSVEKEGVLSHKTSEKTAADVENRDSVNSPNETEQMTPEQEDQKRATDLATQEELARIKAESETLLNMVSGALARHEITTDFLDKFMSNLENREDISEEELRRQTDVFFNTMMPYFVEQLKALPAEKQRALSERLRSTVSTIANTHEEAEELQNRMSELLRTHGVQLPD